METMNIEFVRQPDGTREPFEPERITRRLFAVAKRLNMADPFLTRELTESIVHFLETDSASSTITTNDIADTVVRVVRELGYPVLSTAYEQRERTIIAKALPSLGTDRLARRHALGRASDRDFSLTKLFPNELVTAHQDGLITIGGLDAPMELAGRVGTTFGAGEYLADVRTHIADAGTYISELRQLAHVHDVRVGSHCRLPINHTVSRTGNLFPSESSPHADDLRAFIRDTSAVLDPTITWYWHLAVNDIDEQLTPVFPTITHGEFVVDQPKRPAWLGPGLSEHIEGALITVQIHLLKLVEMLGGWPVDANVLCAKAAALARFAKTAGHVKQDWLRKHGDDRLRAAFLLERAPVVIVPHGLADLISQQQLFTSDLPRQLLEVLRHAIETDRPRQIPVVLDSLGRKTALIHLPATATRADWKMAGQLCLAAQHGLVTHEFNGGLSEAQDLLRQACKLGITRLRFTEPGSNQP